MRWPRQGSASCCSNGVTSCPANRRTGTPSRSGLTCATTIRGNGPTPNRQGIPAEAELLRGRQHQGLRGDPVPFPGARFRRDPARGRHLAGLAAVLCRFRALVHARGASVPRSRPARRRPGRAAVGGPVPVPAAEPRAAHRPAGGRLDHGRPASVPAARGAHLRRVSAAVLALHPLRDLRRVSLPGQRKGRRPGRLRGTSAAVPERHAAHQDPGHASGDRRARACRHPGGRRTRRPDGDILRRPGRGVRRRDQLGRAAAGLGQRAPSRRARQRIRRGRPPPDDAQQLLTDRLLEDPEPHEVPENAGRERLLRW